jgi:glycosyltransferase involved in cell wall biosynthesis
MKVFVLPSWYPTATHPISGAFVRDQARALADSGDDLRVVVGTWDHADGALSLREPAGLWRAWRWKRSLPPGPSWSTDGKLAIVRTPALSWTLRVAGGGVAGLLDASRRNLAAAIERHGRFDLLHAHVGFPAGHIARELSREHRLPYVLTEHMSPFPFPALRRGGTLRPELRQAFEDAARVLGVSPGLAADIAGHGLPCHAVVPNVVDERRFALAPPPPGPFVFMALGALRPQKGFDLLLQALQRWNPDPSEVRLVIGGDGPLRAALESQARRLRVADRVRFLGAVAPEDVPGRMAASHAFVLPSRHETFGVVVAEALASGRPVVATRCGGPESFVDEGCGRLVEVGDVQALAQAMQWMKAHAAEFDPVALRARIERLCSRAAVSAQLRSIYASVLEGRP